MDMLTPAMIESPDLLGVIGRKPLFEAGPTGNGADGAGFGFSLADARAGLVGQAGTALKVHGSTGGQSPLTATAGGHTASPSSSASQHTEPAHTGSGQSAATQTFVENRPQVSDSHTRQPPASGAHTAPVRSAPLQLAQSAGPVPTGASPGQSSGRAVQPATQTQLAAQAPSLSANRSARPVQTSPSPSTTPTAPTETAPVEPFANLIAKRLEDGRSAFTVRLDPPQLGRVEIHLTTEGSMPDRIVFFFEKEAALDLFRRDSQLLQESLIEAGLAGDEAMRADIEFNLAPQDQPSQPPPPVRSSYASTVEQDVAPQQALYTGDHFLNITV